MKASTYYRACVVPKRPYLTDEIVARAILEATVRQVQSDGRVRLWATVPDLGGRWLRIVLLEDAETVHNAFIDRGGPPSKGGE